MAELNGEPVSSAALTALALTNYGHFTTLRITDGRVKGLGLHLERLNRDCAALFDAELDPDRVRRLVRRLVPPVGTLTARVTVFDPSLTLASLGAPAQPQVLVTTRPAPAVPAGPLAVRTVPFVRDCPSVKSVGLFGALRHGRAARRAGWDDVLFTDEAGRLSEGGTWNVGLVRGQEVVWPSAASLPGVTRALLAQLPGHRYAPVADEQLVEYDAVFATNAVTGVRPISRVDDREFPELHPVLRELREAYEAIEGDPL
ncbi:aminotransferase class IV [Streptomyces sp. XM4193]|uniref:aminotransferase class IV n=1 Tax=Streptomyces sp. XM4193 TaxID=2929782 RepID=UPI001FF972FF|nr:aminotransferase class IV [Streptomyces sp. XM4193]MCK1796819.1 aminotransferase class IV [Streptomyces sp. XM4193]